MEKNNSLYNIPVEKLQFANREDYRSDSKFETKPVSYFHGAFKRFCKNKGAVVGGIVVLCLILFSIIAPFFTPFQPVYYDQVFSYVTPKLDFFADNNIKFWDGGRVKSTSYVGYLKDLALAQETGRDVIMNNEVEISEDHAATAHNDDLAELSCPYCGTVTVWVAGSWRRLVQKLREDGVPLPHGFGKAELVCHACGKHLSTMPLLKRGRK